LFMSLIITSFVIVFEFLGKLKNLRILNDDKLLYWLSEYLEPCGSNPPTILL